MRRSNRFLPSLRSQTFSTANTADNVIFNRELKQRQRTTAARQYAAYEYLREECADRLVDRLDDISRSFPTALELGSYRGAVASALRQRNGPEVEMRTGGVEKLLVCDLIRSSDRPVLSISSNGVHVQHLETNDEALDVEDSSVDLVLSSLSMHWVNDIPGTLGKIKRVLKPDGAFLCSMLGGSTLQELRHCFYLAEQERKGGISPHCSPLVRPSDIAGLMHGAGFSLPTIDVDNITIAYPDVFTLMEHLQGMGEQMATFNREYHVGRDTFLSMASIYQDMYGDGDGGIRATFQVVYMIGWSPHASQPSALQRGSAQMSLKNVL